MDIKRRGYVAGGILAGALAVLSLPSLVQWDGYKPDVTQALQKRLGRQVVLEGPLTLSLLPLPHASIEGVRLANAEGAADADMLKAQRLELRPALLPLLTGRIELASVTLSGALLHLQRLPDGKANWQFTPEAARTEGGTGSSDASPAKPHDPTFPAIRLEEALVTYRAGGGVPLRLAVTAADLRRTSEGGLAFAAKLQAKDLPFELQGRLGTDGHATIGLALEKQAGQIALDGSFTTEAGFSGKLDAKAASLHDLAEALGWTTARLPPGGASLKGDLALDAHRMHLDHGTAGLAGAEGTASLEADFGHGPQIDAALSFQHLDLDQWAASLPAPTLRQTPQPPAKEPGAPSAAPADEIQPTPAKSSGGFSKALSVTLDVTADSLTLKGGKLSQARFNAALANGELLVNQAGVEIPGEGELDLFGFFTPEDGGITFDGTLEGRSDDLRSTLSWLGLPAVHLAEDRLRKGSFTGRFLANAKDLRLESGVLKLDGAKADLAADLKLGPRPALGVSFAVDKLDLDAYRAKGSAPAPQSAAPTAAPPKAEGAVAPPPDPVRDSWLPGVDANVKGKVGTLTAYGLTAHGLSVDANWLNGVLTLREVAAPDLDGASLRLTGGLVPAETAFRQFHWEVRSDHPGMLVRELVNHLPVDPDRLGPLALTGSLDGKPSDQLTLDSRNEIAGGQLEITGRIDHALDRPGLHLSLAASHASFAQVLRLSSPDYHPRDNLGAFAASVKLEGTLEEALALQDLRIKLGPAAMAGAGKISLAGMRPRLELKLTAGELAADPFLPTRRTGDARPTLREQIEQGLLIPAKGVPASSGHSRWPGDNEQPPAPSSAPRPQVAVGTASGRWPASPLPLEALGTLDAAIAIDAQAFSWGETRLEPASLGLEIQDGSAKLDHLKGGLWGGEMLLSGALADNGAAKLEAKLAHAQMKQALLSTAGLGMASGMLDAETSLTAKGKSVAEMVMHLNGTAKIQGQDGSIKGFDLKAVDDKARDLSNPLGLINLIQAGLTGGSTHFSALSGNAKVKDGIVSCDDLTLTADGGGAKGEVNINLPDWVMDSRIAFHLASSPDAPPLVMRLTGALDNPRRFLDINAMQGWLAQKGVVVKGPMKDAGEALGKMLSGQRKDDGSKVKAKDVVKGLLKGLTK